MPSVVAGLNNWEYDGKHQVWYNSGNHFSTDLPTRLACMTLFIQQSTYNRASDVCVYVSHVLDRKLLERLMSPSPKSQVMFASAFS